ncbi:hypothetical protein BN140_2120 [Methanoculleus bourgensis MS2]|uniref:Uncharacterized protein n=1 Tax=Methanoculleus bourgensis (strain ATCC 43281 / DSM 3045 / OCM 15 / MS2) TaxID=1201294 RepID=I7JAB5_METBM|nr:hypothetical protein BN140_2120 [Methanoculleus bourgensis MS2]
MGCDLGRAAPVLPASPGEEQGAALRRPAGEGMFKFAHRVGKEIDTDPGEVREVRGDPLDEGTAQSCARTIMISRSLPGTALPSANDPKRTTRGMFGSDASLSTAVHGPDPYQARRPSQNRMILSAPLIASSASSRMK